MGPRIEDAADQDIIITDMKLSNCYEATGSSMAAENNGDKPQGTFNCWGQIKSNQCASMPTEMRQEPDEFEGNYNIRGLR